MLALLILVIKNYRCLGDTTLSITTPDDKIITASDSRKTDGENRAVTAKRVPYGSTVTVKTTINPDATFAGHNGSDYYVKGFSVNGIFGGVLSQTEGENHSSYEYTYTFKVNQEIYGSKLEITPVYFLKMMRTACISTLRTTILQNKYGAILLHVMYIMVVVRQH